MFDEEKKKVSYEVIVMSSDGYSNYWPAFTFLYDRYGMKDAPIAIYSNNMVGLVNGISVVAAGDGSWCERIKYALGRVESDFIILLLEDYLFSRKVDTNKLDSVIRIFQSSGVKYMKLFMDEFGSRGIDKTRAAYANTDYEMSLQPSIWDKEYLISMLPEVPADPWQIEQYFNKVNLGCDLAGIAIINKQNLLNITHAVVKGKILPPARKMMIREGVACGANNKMAYLDFIILVCRLKIKRSLPKKLYMMLRVIIKKLGSNIY